MHTFKLFVLYFLFVVTPVFLFAQPVIKDFDPYLLSSNQVVFVTAPNWNTIQAKMQLYSRRNNKSQWIKEGEFDVTIGRNGLGFDSTSTLRKPDSVVYKHEGDGRSPAGIFSLGPVFSYHNEAVAMPFKRVDTTDICVDDIQSSFYNRLINADTIQNKDWRSFEYMRRKDNLYEYGVWVKYNSDKIFAGNGSCIFLHIWEGSTSCTSGCTAMQKENILTLIHWLNSNYNPVLVQTGPL